ncbi:catalase-like domain-containing protein [Microdochium trichocladiopsis]|uniref:Catalase-like domain-containing protein n=1 Tax=Microdochium trichocladiopsis TaxID=1682393 RepID=A0A9P9BJD4_9PEZI|nr:catalase-like domain-containing protein [Microdochium trichocladiopsis]KAH7018033.1 catalase-like domain-containing protein [Microdochium trichocladiopsis]
MTTTFPKQPAFSKAGATAHVESVTTDSNDNLSQELVDAMQAIFGKHQGYRTTHAKGLLVQGTFTPTPEAKNLTTAAHFNKPSTPITARFSVGGGIPNIPDASDTATPKGVAIRFQLGGDTYTDLIAHSFNGFATRTGEDFLTFLGLILALRQGKPDAQQNMGAFLKSHPEAQTFFTADKPNPHNYGTIVYYQPNTHVLTNAQGKKTNLRYRLVPQDGEHLYTKDELPGLAPAYLHEDLLTRFPAKPLVLELQAHIPGPEDAGKLEDATQPYASQTFIPVGKIVLDKVLSDNAATQQQIAFSPVPEKGGVSGIESSGDPLISARKGVYWVSSDQRRHERRTEDVGFKMP